MRHKQPTAGGLFILLGFIGGTFYGATKGQIIIGALGGIALGLVIAALLWLRESKRDKA